MKFAGQNKGKQIVAKLRHHGALAEAARVEDCGTWPIIFNENFTRKTRIVPQHCGSRFCPRCGRDKREKLADRIRTILDIHDAKELKVITLTQRDRRGESLEKAGERFRKSFNKLRRSKFWTDRISGYYIRYEVEYNSASEWWHYHAHILAESRWVAREGLKDAWSKRAGGAFIVTVQGVINDTVRELSKYFAKFKNDWSFPVAEFARYLGNHQMFAFCGSFRKFNGVVSDNPDQSSYTYVGSIERCLCAMRFGEVDANLLSLAFFLLYEDIEFESFNPGQLKLCKNYISLCSCEAISHPHTELASVFNKMEDEYYQGSYCVK